MRISDVFTSKPIRTKRKLTSKFLVLGALITGLISTLVIFVTIYGQYTGTFTLSIQKDALDKGIILSETIDFSHTASTLKVKPITEAGEMQASDINVEDARNTDGQYIDPIVPYYIAYTFYLKNTGTEVIDLSFRLRLIESYKGIENALMVRYIQENLNTGQIFDETYLTPLDSQYIINDTINQFINGHVQKITVFIWFEGPLTDSSMAGGGVKLDLAYTISNAEAHDD